MTDFSKYDLRGAKIGNFADSVTGKQIYFHQESTTVQQRQNLVAAATEIQKLLHQLEKTNPSATRTDQLTFIDAHLEPNKRDRLIGAVREGGIALLDEVPYGSVIKALVEGWQKPKPF